MPHEPGHLPSPFLDFLEEPSGQEVAFFGQQPRFGQSDVQKNFFRNQFRNILNEFQGQLGQQILGGELPSLKFTDFLRDFDFGQRFASTAPSLRGGPQASLFAPRTRSLFF